MTEIIMATYDIIEGIKSSLEFQKLLDLKKEIDIKHELEINDFQKAKKAFEDVLDLGGKYNKDFSNKANEFSKAKAELYEKELVQEYLSLERKIEKDLNDFMQGIFEYISPNRKVVKTLCK